MGGRDWLDGRALTMVRRRAPHDGLVGQGTEMGVGDAGAAGRAGGRRESPQVSLGYGDGGDDGRIGEGGGFGEGAGVGVVGCDPQSAG